MFPFSTACNRPGLSRTALEITATHFGLSCGSSTHSFASACSGEWSNFAWMDNGPKSLRSFPRHWGKK